MKTKRQDKSIHQVTAPHFNTENVVQPQGSSATKGDNRSISQPLRKAVELIANGKFEEAYRAVGANAMDPESLNVKGVCLLRMGRINEAIGLYRGLVLVSGNVWTRDDRPLHYKTNYATALLIGEHPAGCVAILSELADETNPLVKRLKTALRNWVATLTFWQRLNWRYFGLEPENCKVKIDFLPGDLFEAADVAPLPTGPNTTDSMTSLRTAA